MTLNKILIASAVFALTAAAPAWAASARAVSFDEKVYRADAIVLADHVGSASERDPSGRWIVTKHRFRVDRALKGAVRGELVVMTPGGSVGGVHQRTIGVPHFDGGDRNVLFLKQRSSDTASILYLDQGTYEVSGSGRDATVSPVPSDLVLVDTMSGKAVSQREPSRRLEEFEQAVRESLRREGGNMQTAAALKADQARIRDWTDDLSDFFKSNQTALLIAALGAMLSVIAWLNRR